MTNENNYTNEAIMRNVITHVLQQQGPNGTLANALVESAVAMLEIANHCVDGWARVRADVVCKKIGDALSVNTPE